MVFHKREKKSETQLILFWKKGTPLREYSVSQRRVE